MALVENIVVKNQDVVGALEQVNTISRTDKDRASDFVSVKDWGAKGDGVTDDTAAIDLAVQSLKAETGGERLSKGLYFPHGHYIYNGAGIVLPTNASIIGEDLTTIIDASANTNSGYLITLVHFCARLQNLRLHGNVNNPNLKGISSTYNSDNGGVIDAVLQDFHYGLDIDRSWYSVYQNIRFRVSNAAVVLNGAHIRIGYNQPTLEVNNINFQNIWMSENQKHSVSVHCPTQNLTWTACSFETRGGPRIKFYSTAGLNTFSLHGCYIEGDCAADAVYLLEGQNNTQEVTCYDCMFRLGSTPGQLTKNARLVFGGGNWGNSPYVNLYTPDSIIVADTADGLPFFGGGIDPYGKTGLWNGSAVNSEPVQVAPRALPIFEANSLIGPYVNFKRHTNTSPVAVFRAYVPVGTSGFARIMLLEITAATKGLSEAYVQGLEKYLITITLPEASTAGTGVHVAKVVSSAKDNAALLADPGFTVSADGYDAVTDSQVYTIYHAVANPTRLGDTVFTMTGSYMENGLSRSTRAWFIRRV